MQTENSRTGAVVLVPIFVLSKNFEEIYTVISEGAAPVYLLIITCQEGLNVRGVVGANHLPITPAS